MKAVAVGAATGAAAGSVSKKKPGESRAEKVIRGILLGGILGNVYKHHKKSNKAFSQFTRKDSPQHTVSDAVKNLGLDKKSIKTKMEVKKKYRKLSMKHHPDKGGDANKMKDINKSWNEIKNSGWYEKLAFLINKEGSYMAQSKSTSILTKVANMEKVKANLENGMKPMEAVKAAYPKWSDEKVKAYLMEMGMMKKAGVSKADVVFEKVANMAALKAGLKMIDKGVRTLGKKVVGAVKKTKMGKKKLKGKMDMRTKKMQRIVGGGTAAAGAVATKKMVD